MHDFLKIKLQYTLPKKALTQFAGWLAGVQFGFVTQSLIQWFIKKYQVNMGEALHPDPKAYASFNEFFTRALKIDARPISSADWICPVDGAISQFGKIQNQQLFQAKGHSYSAQALLGGDGALAQQFNNGHFACLYLSPKDYHRIHMPVRGTLRQMIYVPGDLFSVNPLTAQHVPGLFARNERVVCVFDTAFGPFVNVLVGATIVGSMATVWHGVVNPPRTKTPRVWHYPDAQQANAITLEQGQEMGRFLLGSTVVMLWPEQGLQFNETWKAGAPVQMGQLMAKVK